MFEISFGELIVIGIVALVIIGPERLPKVARTVGALIGRAQRFVHSVKTDIQREVNVSELKQLQADVTDAARQFEDSVRKHSDDISQPLQDVRDSLRTTPSPNHTDPSPPSVSSDSKK